MLEFVDVPIIEDDLCEGIQNMVYKKVSSRKREFASELETPEEERRQWRPTGLQKQYKI